MTKIIEKADPKKIRERGYESLSYVKMPII